MLRPTSISPLDSRSADFGHKLVIRVQHQILKLRNHGSFLFVQLSISSLACDRGALHLGEEIQKKAALKHFPLLPVRKKD